MIISRVDLINCLYFGVIDIFFRSRNHTHSKVITAKLPNHPSYRLNRICQELAMQFGFRMHFRYIFNFYLQKRGIFKHSKPLEVNGRISNDLRTCAECHIFKPFRTIPVSKTRFIVRTRHIMSSSL